MLSCQFQRSVHEIVIVGRQIARDWQLSQQSQGATLDPSIEMNAGDLIFETFYYLLVRKVRLIGFDCDELCDLV